MSTLKTLLMAYATFVLAGCATVGSTQRAAAHWEGKHIDVALAKLGPPSGLLRIGEVSRKVKDTSGCPFTRYGYNLPDTQNYACLRDAPLKTVIVSAGTGEKRYFWRNEKKHGAWATPTYSTGTFDGYIGSTPVSGTVRSQTGVIVGDPFTGFCTLTLTTDTAGVITEAAIATDDAGACEHVT